MVLSKKNIAFITAIILLVAAGYFYKEYQRKPADITRVEPVAKINVATIVDLYENNETKANQQYLGKIIQVSGTITDINNQQDTLINISLGDSSSLHKVSCLLDKRHMNAIKKYKPGEAITIKGICTGFLLDVELNRCVIVNDNKP
jgi:hypothetical protein